MRNLTRRHHLVLRALPQDGSWAKRSILPDGNGRAGQCTMETLRELEKRKLILHMPREEFDWFIGCRLTPMGAAHGRALLAEARDDL